MIRSRLRPCIVAAFVLALLSALPGSPAQPPGKDKPTIRLTRAGEMKLDDVSVEDGAVIDESTVVVVGTTLNKDAEEDPDKLGSNGAIVNLARRSAEKFTNGHTARICSVSAGRGRVATISNHHDPVLRVWDLKAGKSVAEIKIEEPDPPTHYAAACFHKSDRVAVAADKRLIVLDPARPDERLVLALPPEVRWLDKPVVSPDDTRVASTGDRAGVVVWEVATRKATTHSLIPKGLGVDELEKWYAHGAAFGPKGILIAWRGGNDGEVPEGKTEKDVPAERRGVVQIDLPDGKVVPLGMGHTGRTLFCAIDPTGTWLATAGSSWRDKPRADGANSVAELRVYHLPTKELAFREQVEGLPLTWVAFTPSGKRVVTADYYGVVRWWDVQGK
jgi:WD40 repeat protein